MNLQQAAYVDALSLFERQIEIRRSGTMVNFVDPLGPAAPGGVIPAQTSLFQIARHPVDTPRFVGAHRARQNVFKDRQAACFRCGIRRCSHGSDDVARGTQQKSRQKLGADETGRAGDENRLSGMQHCLTSPRGDVSFRRKQLSVRSVMKTTKAGKANILSVGHRKIVCSSDARALPL